MTTNRCFPFGQPLQLLRQADRRPKKVFVLGVYASAVHARWIGPDGKNLVRALAVASEPYIFWRGEGAEQIIRNIPIAPQVGTLLPADSQLNGPSGVALDDLFLKPLGLTRNDAWLCDLVPHSCTNPSQQAAIERAYLPLAATRGLPAPSLPPVPRIWTDDARRREIMDELVESQAQTLILLGDLPIKWFLHFFDPRWNALSDFEPYGRLHDLDLLGHRVQVLPLTHPKNAGRLGPSSDVWATRHEKWTAGQSRR